MFIVSPSSCLCAIFWSQVSSGEWRYSWSSADRRCSNYIGVINNLISYESASYIRDLMVYRYNGYKANLTYILETMPSTDGQTDRQVESSMHPSNFIGLGYKDDLLRDMCHPASMSWNATTLTLKIKVTQQPLTEHLTRCMLGCVS